MMRRALGGQARIGKPLLLTYLALSGVLAASPGALTREFEQSLRRVTGPHGAQDYL